ncbi:MAG: hypothetical protein EOS23_13810 [Mesorhizobium sp.]|uniref:hypothetical protein n=1 Tax=Mesorhizobium sp. TaxID=1871066 RepID=UPI000FE4CF48|nr:hypothetical protein [Mesorhizobium sp.]RWE10488.1 MAG: hypothetical protein EOS23_13810 [Mesorhizobium sp.]RWH79862.1 MAG: hypothetical protein EOQ85_12830 [Mesorhizobium sp.]RWH82330.1 MAG: hypothetical protein EOQ86_13380 [Mesorhizobium sp.]RWH89389.1 MAG: hypothetical protein EOQ87_16030 [Mesorhizobium sp.]RWI01483.1 MAG: hypothetical protein EOQ88_03325 [Mesorhizobium sp.]
MKEAVSDINTDRIGSFLTSLEVERGSCDPQCKAGGDAYLARFLISEHPEYMDTLQLGGTCRISRRARNQERPGAYRPPHAFWSGITHCSR